MHSTVTRQGPRPQVFHHRLAHLVINKGWAKNRIRPISVPVFLIGAGSECDLVLGDLRFPEVHSYIAAEDDGLCVRWLGEGPELRVNGEATRKTRLHDGDRLDMNCYQFVICTPDQPGNELIGTADDDNSASLAHAEQMRDDVRQHLALKQRDQGSTTCAGRTLLAISRDGRSAIVC